MRRTRAALLAGALAVAPLAAASPAAATSRPEQRRAFICRAGDVRGFSSNRVNCAGRILTPAPGFIFVRDADGTVWMIAAPFGCSCWWWMPFGF